MATLAAPGNERIAASCSPTLLFGFDTGRTMSAPSFTAGPSMPSGDRSAVPGQVLAPRRSAWQEQLPARVKRGVLESALSWAGQRDHVANTGMNLAAICSRVPQRPYHCHALGGWILDQAWVVAGV